MITQNPYHTGGYTKPGYGEPEPLKPVSTIDSPEAVERCLNCRVPSERCSGQCYGMQFRQAGSGRPLKAPLERVAKMVRDGWADSAICRELGIAPKTLEWKKSQCYTAGLLEKCGSHRKEARRERDAALEGIAHE